MKKFLVLQKYIKINWLAMLSGLIIGIMLGLSIYTVIKTRSLSLLEGRTLRDPDPNYPLINPIIGYDNAEATNFKELVNFKEKLSNLINQEESQNDISKISVYFRDLNAGRWISVNENEQYAPASLFKVPLMISYYHLSEGSPLLFSTRITFKSANDIKNEQTIQPSQQLKIGKSYTVDELIQKMIIYSDNDSFQLLYNLIDPRILEKIYSDMDNFLPTNGGVQDFVYIKNYALFFRVLYGSTYLNRSNSEKAMELLSKTSFKDGLIAGVPQGIVVSHKFGEFGLEDPKSGNVTNREFHDCGIIFYTKEPYLLCVMTKGSDLHKLEKSVKDVSKLVFSEV